MYIIGNTYRIFISSTFKDMDLERDVIKNIVIPQLNRTYAKYNIEFIAVDLRYGINTSGFSEEEANQKVLSMCVDTIEVSQPFFISFIGNRYGWIPKKEDWKNLYHQLDDEQQKFFDEADEISVTEMEIRYADYFSKVNNTNSNCLFFIRSEDSIESLSAESYSDFIETSDEQIKRLHTLKVRIEELCKSPNNSLYPYSIDYRNIEESQNNLAKLIINSLTGYIESHLKKSSIQSIESLLKDWEKESSKTISYFAKLYKESLYREGEEFVKEGNVMIIGNPYTGKSTYLARQYFSLYNEDCINLDSNHRKILLCARVNTSKYSRSIQQIMGRWVIELSKIINVPLETELINALTDPSVKSKDNIITMFYEIVDLIRSVGHSVHIFIDDVDKFTISSPGDEMLAWVDDRVTIYSTASSDSSSIEKMIQEMQLKILAVPEIIIDNEYDFINRTEWIHNCELPNCVKREIANYNINYLEIELLFVGISLLNKVDFSYARKDFTYLESIEKTLIDFFASIPTDYYEALDFFLDFYSNKMKDGNQCKEIFNLLRHSSVGLRDVDIMELLSDNISELELHQIIHYFRVFINVEKDTGLISLKHHCNKILSYDTYNKIQNYVQQLPVGNYFKILFENSNIDDSFIPDGDDVEELYSKVYTSISKYNYDIALSIVDNLIQNYDSGYKISMNELIMTRMNILAYKGEIANATFLLDVLLKRIVQQEDLYTELEASLDAYRNRDWEEALSCGLMMRECIESMFISLPFGRYIFYSYISDLFFEKEDYENSLEFRRKAIDILKCLPYAIEACYAYSYMRYALSSYFQKLEDDFYKYTYDIELDYALQAEEIINHRRLEFRMMTQLFIMIAEIYRYSRKNKECALEYYEKSISNAKSCNRIDHVDEVRKFIEEMEQEA